MYARKLFEFHCFSSRMVQLDNTRFLAVAGGDL